MSTLHGPRPGTSSNNRRPSSSGARAIAVRWSRCRREPGGPDHGSTRAFCRVTPSPRNPATPIRSRRVRGHAAQVRVDAAVHRGRGPQRHLLLKNDLRRVLESRVADPQIGGSPRRWWMRARSAVTRPASAARLPREAHVSASAARSMRQLSQAGLKAGLKTRLYFFAFSSARAPLRMLNIA